MRRSYLVILAVLCCGGIAYATGSITVTGYPAVPRTLKGGPGISIGADGTFTATGDAIVTGAQPFENLSSALRGKYLGATGTATNAIAYKGNAAPNATEFSYLQGVSGAIQTQLNGKADTSSLSLVATTGQYSNLSGKPALSAVATSGAYSDLTGKPTLSTVATSGDYADLANKPTLSTVAGTGSYTDLANKPVIPAAQVNSDWNATTGVTKINNKPTLATVATSGNYSDLNGKPVAYTLPTATTTVLGGVKIDGNSIQIDGAGVIHSTVAAGVSSVNGYTGIIDLQTTDITGFGNYSASTNAKLAAKMDNVNPAFTGTLSTTNADGTWRMNVRNSVSRSYTPQEGDMDTDAAGKLWLYTSGAWVEKGAPYTLPTADANTKGGVQIGTTLAMNSGVLDVSPSYAAGLATVELTGDASLTPGSAYLATGTGTWTFSTATSTKQTVLNTEVSGTVCAASGSLVYWTNPITDTAYSGQCVSVPASNKVEFQMSGGKTYARVKKNLQLASVPAASVSPTSLAFGNVVAGSTSSPLTATMTNSGLTNLITGTPTISGTDAARFAISSNGCSAATVAAGSTCTESVTFTPSAAGSYSAQLNIPHNATGSPTVVALTGSSTTQAVLAITDSFARANQNPLRNGDNASETPTGTWASVAAMGGDAYIYNAALAKVGGYTSLMYWAHDTFAANQYASATVTAVTAGPAVRINTTTGDRYYLAIGNSSVTLNRYSGGTTTALQSYTVAVTTSKVYRLEASGSTLTVKVDGVAQSPTVTDSTLTSGQAGIYFGVNSQVGNFTAGNL